MKKRGRPPTYPDRVALLCAYFVDCERETIVTAARELGLPVERGEVSYQSPYQARQLLRRGRRLLGEIGGCDFDEQYSASGDV